jgi:hypothetical protein
MLTVVDRPLINMPSADARRQDRAADLRHQGRGKSGTGRLFRQGLSLGDDGKSRQNRAVPRRIADHPRAGS